MKPTIGRIVHYHSKHGDGVISPAIVLRTRDTTVPGVIDRWGPSPDGTLSGKGRPAELVPVLPDDMTVDLLAHGLGGDYREYATPYAETPTPGHWSWPPREEAISTPTLTGRLAAPHLAKSATGGIAPGYNIHRGI